MMHDYTISKDADGSALDHATECGHSMRTRPSAGIAGIGLLVVLSVVPVWGHHSFSSTFDVNKPVKVEGTIKRVEWVNPHVWIFIDVTTADGTVKEWAVEGGLPIQLVRRGLGRGDLVPGTEIIVDGYQARDGSRRANGGDLTFLDGRKSFLGFSTVTDRPEPSNRPRSRR